MNPIFYEIFPYYSLRKKRVLNLSEICHGAMEPLVLQLRFITVLCHLASHFSLNAYGVGFVIGIRGPPVWWRVWCTYRESHHERSIIFMRWPHLPQPVTSIVLNNKSRAYLWLSQHIFTRTIISCVYVRTKTEEQIAVPAEEFLRPWNVKESITIVTLLTLNTLYPHQQWS